MKPGYVHSLKNSIRSLTEQPWVYAIEVTDIFYNLTERARFEIMLNLLKRIPESEVANGKMITFNTFEGFSDDFEKITTSLNLT